MSLRPQTVEPVPDDASQVARAAFPGGDASLTLRDELGNIFHDADFAALHPPRGRPAEAPGRLALATGRQFVEQLSDRQAADAVCGRSDWKYARRPGLDDPGFDSSVLCEFRARLVAGSAERRRLDALLEICRGRGWQRTDSTPILARARAISRLERVIEAMRHALNSLASAAPERLRAHAHAERADRYGRRPDVSRLSSAQQPNRVEAIVGMVTTSPAPARNGPNFEVGSGELSGLRQECDRRRSRRGGPDFAGGSPTKFAEVSLSG